MTTPMKPQRSMRLAAAVAVLHLVVALTITRPLILPDEAGYLLNARRIATFGDPSQLVYFPGYSILIAPIFALTNDLSTVFRAAQVVNGLLSGLTAFLTFAVLPRLYPDLSKNELRAGVAVVALYPSYLFFSSLAVSENLFVPVVVLAFLLFLRFAEQPTVVRAVALGITSGAAILVHQRAIALSFAAVVGLIVVAGPRHRAVLAGLAATVVALVGGFALAMFILDPSVDTYQFGVSSRTTVSGLVTDSLGPRALFTLPFTILGQFFYISVASLGIVPIAIVWLVRQLRHGVGPSASLRSNAAVWLGALAVSTALIAGLFMNQGTGDKAIYGRYLEAILAPLLSIGIIELLRRAPSRSLRPIVSVPAAAAAILLAVRGTDAFVGREQLLNIATIEPVVRFVGIDIFWIAAVGVIGTALLLEVVRRWGTNGLLLVAVAWIVATGFVFDRATQAQANLASEQVLGQILTDDLLPLVVPEQRCVAVDDAATASPWYQQNYRLEQFEVSFERWDSDSAAEPCGAFVLASRPDLETIIPGATVVAAEAERNFLVWFVGDTADLVDQAPIGSPSPTAFLEQTQLIELSEPVVVAIEDESILVEITLTNTTEHVLVPSRALPEGLGGIAVGIEWKRPGDSERLHEPRRAGLPGVLLPGQQVTLEGELPYDIPGEDEFGATNGTWDIHFEVVQEGWRWAGPATGVTSAVVVPATPS